MSVAMALFLCGCTEELPQQQGYGRPSPPEAFLHWEDRWLAKHENRIWNMVIGRPFPCGRWGNDPEFGTYQFSVATDQCVHMTKPQRWQGYWRDEFEGSQFCPGEAPNCGLRFDNHMIWLNVGEKSEPTGKLYRVDFIGRRTQYPGPFGHFGMFEHEMIVDRMISMRRVSDLPLSGEE